jgi:hypothetical protein
MARVIAGEASGGWNNLGQDIAQLQNLVWQFRDATYARGDLRGVGAPEAVYELFGSTITYVEDPNAPNFGQPTGGTFTGLRGTFNNNQIFDIQGFNVPVPTFVSWIFSGDNNAYRTTIYGGADEFIGTSFADTLVSFGGNDVLRGSGGNDSLDGGAGTDTSAYAGAFRQYAYSPGTTNQLSGIEGTDSLVAIENLAFVDGRLTVDPADHMAQAYRLYVATLDRTPDPLGLNFQSARLDAGVGLTQVAEGFVNSPEFQSKYGNLNNAQFVFQLYQNVLDRGPTSDEVIFHTNRLAAGASRADVVVGFSESPEFINKEIGPVNAGLWDIDESAASVARLYFGMLERAPETSGLAFYEGEFAKGLTVQQVANNFAESPEFRGKYGALDNSQFVTQLYLNVLDRQPTASEVNFHVSRLTAGATRGDVAAGFTESPEYQVKTLPFVDQGIAVADTGFVLP